MSFLNVNLGLLAYQDGPSTNQPRLRLADLQWSLQGITTNNFKNIPISLAPGETQTITTTARTLTVSPSDTFEVTNLGSGIMRVAGDFVPRTGRAYGDGTTQWTTTKSGSAVKMQAVGGTMPTFAGMSVGDQITIAAGFNPLNQGTFIILSKGADYVEFVNPYAEAEVAVMGTLYIYSPGPVQKGDTLDITASEFAFPNQGSFSIVAVTDQYIDVLNPNVFPQSVTNVNDGFTIYQSAFKWMALMVDRKIFVGLNGDAPGKVEVEPAVEGDLAKNPGMFVKRGKVFEVQLKNSGQQVASGFLILAE